MTTAPETTEGRAALDQRLLESSNNESERISLSFSGRELQRNRLFIGQAELKVDGPGDQQDLHQVTAVWEPFKPKCWLIGFRVELFTTSRYLRVCTDLNFKTSPRPLLCGHLDAFSKKSTFGLNSSQTQGIV